MTMTNDPAGLTHDLSVDPSATEAAIHAAYRRKARVLHPDVPGTGNAGAFVSVKEAYDVLGDAEQRAAYDRSAHRAAAPPPVAATVAEPAEDEDDRMIAWPPFSDLPIALWIGVGGLFCIAAAMAVFEFSRPAPQEVVSDVRPFAPTVAPVAVAPASVPTSGAATHYVLPGGGDAVLWRHDASHDTFLPAGRIADFTRGAGARPASRQWVGGDPPRRWRQRLRRRLSSGAGRPLHGTPCLLRLQFRRAAA